ncbi:hypothetical protein AS9A_3806 [Hoyosella subflava DQS3-9A1]|uniref:Uncharacterized protein n=1 Tax=Hoyosella subflava (strain DSM 45089 / JCM 17490 / NBRC 109087 / DQS3-9A1) TaxID=443218 RepID=F6EFY1_HOYSD|nr:hypothetical protein AS9A_3806 [Hoyosella subflava DQS3-9A1]
MYDFKEIVKLCFDQTQVWPTPFSAPARRINGEFGSLPGFRNSVTG